MTPFESLDFVYAPSRDVAAEVRRLVEDLGATAVFAIEAFGARVAMLRLTDGPPSLLLADHVAGERPILVYRVEDLDAAAAALSADSTPGRSSACPMVPVTRSCWPAGTGSRSTSSRDPGPTSA